MHGVMVLEGAFLCCQKNINLPFHVEYCPDMRDKNEIDRVEMNLKEFVRDFVLQKYLRFLYL